MIIDVKQCGLQLCYSIENSKWKVVKNLNRIITIGLSQFCYENMKTEKDGMVILRRTLKNISSDYSNDYEDLNKYSFDYEFRDRELKIAI